MMVQSVTRADILKRARNMRQPTSRQVSAEFDRIQDPHLQPEWLRDMDDYEYDPDGYLEQWARELADD